MTRKGKNPKRLGSTIDLTTDEDNEEIVQISDDDEEVVKNRTEKQLQKQRESIIRYERSQSEASFTEQFCQLASEVHSLSKTNENLESLINQLRDLKVHSDDEKNKSKVDLLADKIIEESNNVVSFNVSGRIFTTTRGTIRKEPESFLTVLIDENSYLPVDKDENGAYLIERSSLLFAFILKYLQNLEESTGIFDRDVLPKDKTVLNALLEEAKFFSLSNLIKVLDNENNVTILHQSSARLVDVWEYENTVREAVVSNQYLEEVNERVQKRKEQLAQQREILTNLVENQHKKELESKRLELESKLTKIRQDLGEIEALQIYFSVSGTIFEMDIFQVFKVKESLICKLVQRYNRPLQETKNHPIFIDREPEYFKHIKHFIEHESLLEDLLYGRSYNKKALIKEAYFFNIIDLVKYLDPVYRFPIEELGSHNVAMKKEEDLLRSFFATNRDHPLLSDPYLLLINVFDNFDTFKKEPFPDRGNILFKKKNGHLFVESREEFEFNFDCFTKGIFKGMDWNGVVMAGGSVLACLTSVPAGPFRSHSHPIATFDPMRKKRILQTVEVISSSSIENSEKEKANIRSSYVKTSDVSMDLLGKSYFYNSKNMYPFADSDIDLFLYGISEEEAEQKIRHIYETIKKNTSTNVVVMRSSMTITMQVCDFRPIQIILRLYKSPSEVLVGFDVDCCCFAFDGTEVFCLPRGRRAIVHSMNFVDIDRQSTTYENRLYKYANRGFSVCVVGMDSDLIVREGLRAGDNYVPSLFGNNMEIIKANFTNCRGLARLLLLERKSIYILNESDKRITEDSIINFNSKERRKLLFNEWDIDSDYLGVLIAFKYRGVPNFFVHLLEHFKDFSVQNPRLVLSIDNIESILDIPKEKLINCELPKRIEWIKINPGRQFIGSFKPVIDNFFEDCYFTNNELVKRRKESNRPIKTEWYSHNPKYSTYMKIFYEKEVEEAYQNYLKDKTKNTYQQEKRENGIFKHLYSSPIINFDTMKFGEESLLLRFETPIASHIYPSNKDPIQGFHVSVSNNTISSSSGIMNVD